MLGIRTGVGWEREGDDVRVGRVSEGRKNVLVTWTFNMSSTLRGSTCTEFHRLTRCIRGVMVNTRSGVK